MALYDITPQQKKVLAAMRSEGLQVKRIYRVYPPYDLGDPQEVLFVSRDNKAGTVFIDTEGKMAHGPFAGFGM